MTYSLLSGVRVLEIAWLAGAALGQHLADMGAEVIKVERPGAGDYTSTVGPYAIGSDDGPSFLHLHWNRGKKSITLDLKTDEGRLAFLELVTTADVVVEGLRAGAMAKWDLGYDVLREANPAIVFCSLSGMGRKGPYSTLPTHGFSYDAYTGMAPPLYRDTDDIPRVPGELGGLLDYNMGGLYAAIGVLAALINAQRTGEGCLIDISQTDALALVRNEKLDVRLNPDVVQRRWSYGEGAGFAESTRSNYYTTADSRVIFLQAVEDKFWVNFCEAVDRNDLLARFPSRLPYDHAPGREDLRQELQAIFKTKPLMEWVQFFIDHDIPGGPVYDVSELLEDPHFNARDNVGEIDYPGLGTLRLTTTPIRIEGQTFTIRPAPETGADNDEFLPSLSARA